MKIFENHSLKNHNTFGVDVKARYFVELNSVDDYKSILRNRELSGMKKVILGEGSNVLFQKDFNGVVIKNCIKGINVAKEDEEIIDIKFGAGENWDEIVEYCVSKGYGGIENLSLIPGLVGAAPIQNIGAYGVELEQVFISLKGIFTENGKTKIFEKDECKFGYRDSIFKNELKGKFVVTEVTLRLSKKPGVNLTYKILQDYCKDKGMKNPTIADIRESVIEIRRSKLPDPVEIGNAGSFFKNPVVNEEKLELILAQNPDLVFFKSGDNYKIPAGWLIETCGLKGYRKGNVGTYPKQALVIVNYGGASGEEIVSFSKMIQTEVMNKFGIFLIPEVNIIPDNSEDSYE